MTTDTITIGTTVIGWSVHPGDTLVRRADNKPVTVLGRDNNVVLARRFTPGRRTFIGRTHGHSAILRLHPADVGMTSITTH